MAYITYEKDPDPNCTLCKGEGLMDYGPMAGHDRCHCTDGKAIPLEESKDMVYLIAYEKKPESDCPWCKGSALAYTYPNGAETGDDYEAQWYRCHCTDGKAVPVETLHTVLEEMGEHYHDDFANVLILNLKKKLGI